MESDARSTGVQLKSASMHITHKEKLKFTRSIRKNCKTALATHNDFEDNGQNFISTKWVVTEIQRTISPVNTHPDNRSCYKHNNIFDIAVKMLRLT